MKYLACLFIIAIFLVPVLVLSTFLTITAQAMEDQKCTKSGGPSSNPPTHGIVTVTKGSSTEVFEDSCIVSHWDRTKLPISRYVERWGCRFDNKPSNTTYGCLGELCYNGVCKSEKDVLGTLREAGNQQFCIEGDSGIDPLIGAPTMSFDGSTLTVKDDICNPKNNDFLNETFCLNNKVTERVFSCSGQYGPSFSCMDGACFKRCTDTDGGFNIYDYGELTHYSYPGGIYHQNNDTCTAEGRLVENSCEVFNSPQDLGEYKNIMTDVQKVGSCQELGAPEGYYCDSDICVKNESYTEILCEDSDGLNPYIKGTVTYGNSKFYDFCYGSILHEYGCYTSKSIFQYDQDCNKENKICYDGACIDPSTRPENKKPQSEIKSITLQTDPRVFGPSLEDPRVGYPWHVGNMRPADSNPDNGTLSDLDPWSCKITFVDNSNVGSVDFSIKNSQTVLFSSKADCQDNVCEGIVPRQTVKRGEEVSCVVSVDGKETKSNTVKVAKTLFILTQNFGFEHKNKWTGTFSPQFNKENSNEIYINFDQQFDFFLRRTNLQNGDYKLIRRGRGECEHTENKQQDPDDIYYGFDRCAKDLREFWRDDVDTVIFASPQFADFGGINVEYVVAVLTNSIYTFAHEAGHRLGNLPDEYDYDQFKGQLEQHGLVGEYSVCCSDYIELDNPYYTITSDNKVDCNTIGRCVNESENCLEAETEFIPFLQSDKLLKTNCVEGNKCCANKVKIGNDCYPSTINPKFEEMDSHLRSTFFTLKNSCAGSPLKSDGTQAALYKVIEQGKKPKLDLNSKYRSIMGGAGTLIAGGFPEENLVYPQTSVELPWPLKPGIPKAA